MQREPGLRVSHEAIYALPRGELRRELIGCLRRAVPARGRKPKGSELRGTLVGMTNINDRPEEIEGRPVPGHWPVDLVLGANGASAIGTLIERTTRFAVPVRIPTSTRRASAAPTRTPTACCGSISRKGRPCRGSARRTSMPSRTA
jgi:IS30 family transposase